MIGMSLERADKLVIAALAHGRQLGLAPLTVAVLDAGGHYVVLKREDGAGILRAEIAFGKAWGALGMGFDSRVLAERAQQLPNFYAALGNASGGRIVPAAGGVLIFDEKRRVIGAVGISGDSSANDEACCLAGIAVAGLQSGIAS
jgi:uncharacterized protein GlcG (DUF336 family)